MNKLYGLSVKEYFTTAINMDISMLNRTAANVAVLFWGSIFCITACIVMIFNKNYDMRKRRWMILMQLSTTILLLCDVAAWISRGMDGTLAYFTVRISNCIVFLTNIVILFFFHKYVCSNLFTEEEEKGLKRVRMMGIICGLAVILIIISQFTNLYYYIDANNVYHRNTGYIISMILPVSGMIIELSFLVQYRERLSKGAFIAFNSYIILPVIAAAIQFLCYGISLIDISICMSMMIIYIAVLNEQNTKLNILSRKQSQTEAELDMSMVLNQCIAELTTGADINVAVHNILAIINNYFGSERCFIFEKNYNQDMLDKTYEYVNYGANVSDTGFKSISMHVAAPWFRIFQEDKPLYVDTTDDASNSEADRLLKSQNINKLIAVPLKRDEDIIGFFGVANPTHQVDDITILSYIQYFITSNLEKKAQQEALYNLSYRDMLTGLYNRNKYISMVESSKGHRLTNVGVAYIDLNGLKKINDNKGHAKGDMFICTAARVLSETFTDNCYRVGGDEFVIVIRNIAQNEFEQDIDAMRKRMKANEVSISMGVLYRDKVDDLEELLKSADKLMYIEKEEFHRSEA